MKRNTRWIAIHTRCHRDAKVAGLSSKAVRWDWLLCLLDAKEQETEGEWQSANHLVNAVGIDRSSADELVTAGLLDVTADGRICVHAWDSWQVKRYDPTAAQRKKTQRERQMSRDMSRDSHVPVTQNVTTRPVSLSSLNELNSEEKRDSLSRDSHVTRNPPILHAPPQGSRRLDGLPLDNAPPTARCDPLLAGSLFALYPSHKRSGKVAFQRAVIEAVERMVAEGRFPTPAIALGYIREKIEIYASTPKGQGKYAHAAANWVANGCYDDEPEAWMEEDGEDDKPETPEQLRDRQIAESDEAMRLQVKVDLVEGYRDLWCYGKYSTWAEVEAGGGFVGKINMLLRSPEDRGIPLTNLARLCPSRKPGDYNQLDPKDVFLGCRVTYRYHAGAVVVKVGENQ